MSKRGAATSLTKDNYESGEEEVDTNQPTEASADKLASRTFVKVRRKPEAPEAAAGFNLTGSTGAAAGFNFDFSKGSETKAEDNTNGAQPAAASSASTTAPSTASDTTTSSATSTTTSAPVVNGFMHLMNPDNWECAACEVSNKKAATKCAACETPKPGSEPVAAAAAPAASGFTFGSATTAPFTFGSPAPIGTGGFTFGSTTSTWNFSSTPDSPFTFGSNSNAVTFGDVSGSSFGSSSPTTFEPQEGLATGGDQTKEEFKNKAPEPSGTEKDTTIFKIPTTVYILTKIESPAEDGGEKKETSKFVETGEGELKVNTVQDGEKKIARVVLRVEKTQRLVLNAPLFSGTTIGLQGDKYVKFASNDLEGKTAVYLLRFKNKTESTQAKDHMEKAIAFTAGK